MAAWVEHMTAWQLQVEQNKPKYHRARSYIQPQSYDYGKLSVQGELICSTCTYLMFVELEEEFPHLTIKWQRV